MHREEVLSLMHICADMGDNSTKLVHCLAVTRSIYSYQPKEITYFFLIGSSCTLILELYSFFV